MPWKLLARSYNVLTIQGEGSFAQSILKTTVTSPPAWHTSQFGKVAENKKRHHQMF